MDSFGDATNADSSIDAYAKATKALAFSVSEQAAKAGDQEIRMALDNLAFASATFADGLIAARTASTTQELAFRSALSTVTEACGLPAVIFAE